MARSIFYDSLKKILFAFVAMMFVAPAFSATLPGGYTELEWLQGNGNTVIVPGVTINSKLKIDIKYEIITAGWLLGGTAGSGGRWGVTSGNTFYSGTSGVADISSATNLSGVNIATFDYATGATVNGVSIPFSATQTYGNVTTKQFYLFTADGTGVATQEHKIYYVKIYDNNELIRNLIPAKNSSNAIGMYDTVSGQFFTNQGTGNFTAGPAIQTYTMLEYIESTGTQYIDTGMKANLNTKAELSFSFYTYSDLTTSWGILGSRAAQKSSAFIIGANNGVINSNSKVFAQFDTVNRSSTDILPSIDFNKHTIEISKNGGWYDGSLFLNWDSTPTSFTTPHNIILFGAYNDTNSSVSYGFVKIYHFKMWDNDVLIRDMKPARRDSDGRVGMLDTVNNVFYDNAASATVNFEAGPDLPEVTIKIATTKYNEDAFANLVTTLNSAITKVTNIVDTTVAQATSIGTLATTKQDRPADGDCPAGRKCLLVTGTDGKPHWYLIQE